MKRIALYPDCIIGAGGDMSDWQYIQSLLKNQYVEEYYQGGGMKAKHVFSLMSRIMYERRSKNDPLWCSLVIAGYDGSGFLGCVDYQGTMYQSETIATGYGAYIAQPILRKQCEGKNLTEEQARKVMNDCLRILFYRDARSLNNVSQIITTGSNSSY
jgi:20S proteasome subunit beta 7